MPNKSVEFTPVSGIEFDALGRFSVGVELMNLPPSPADGANVAVKSCEIPSGFRTIVFDSGSARIQEDPKHTGRAVALFRAHLAAEKDDTAAWHPVNLAVGSIGQDGQLPIGPSREIPLYPGDKFLVVELQEAAGVGGVNVELQISGHLVP